MTEFFQQLLNGLALGSIFALIALGYTMIYGVLRFINFAHSEVFMVGAFIGLYTAQAIGAQGWLGLLGVMAAAMLGCALLGVTIERLCYRPLRERPRNNVLITAIGVSLLLQNGGQVILGADPKPFPEIIADFAIPLPGGLMLPGKQLLAIIVAAVLLVALLGFVYGTKMGVAMRATSFNSLAASYMGISNDRVFSVTFFIGSALAGAGGVLYALNYPTVEPLMGVLPGTKAFIAAVIGGIGSISGAALGGLVLGVIESFAKGSEWSTFTDAIAFALLIVILLVKPTGLLGRKFIEKV